MKLVARMRRIAIHLILLMGVVLLIVGAVEIYISRGLPAFTEEAAVGSLQMESPPEDAVAKSAFFANWHERRWSLEGGRFVLFDKGTFDLTLGLLFLVGATFSAKLGQTARRKRLALELVAGAVFAIGVGAFTAYSAMLDYERQRLNMFADSLGIPMMSALFGSLSALVLLAILIPLVGLGLRRRKQELWPFVMTTPKRALVCGLVFIPILALSIASTLSDRAYSASWLGLVVATAFILLLSSWYQSALTPPQPRASVVPENAA